MRAAGRHVGMQEHRREHRNVSVFHLCLRNVSASCPAVTERAAQPGWTLSQFMQTGGGGKAMMTKVCLLLVLKSSLVLPYQGVNCMCPSAIITDCWFLQMACCLKEQCHLLLQR